MARGPDKAEADRSTADRRTDLATERNALAVRRNDLAAERTELAWWRTALASIVVAFGVGRIGPEISTEGPEWPYAVVGTAFGIFAVACFIRGRKSNPHPMGQSRPVSDTALSIAALTLCLAVIALIVLL